MSSDDDVSSGDWDLPKIIKTFMTAKNRLDLRIHSLLKIVINENSTAMSILDSADLTIKHATQSWLLPRGRCRSSRPSCQPVLAQ